MTAFNEEADPAELLRYFRRKLHRATCDGAAAIETLTRDEIEIIVAALEAHQPPAKD